VRRESCCRCGAGIGSPDRFDRQRHPAAARLGGRWLSGWSGVVCSLVAPDVCFGQASWRASEDGAGDGGDDDGADDAGWGW
jgi:hypothetical protein